MASQRLAVECLYTSIGYLDTVTLLELAFYSLLIFIPGIEDLIFTASISL